MTLSFHRLTTLGWRLEWLGGPLLITVSIPSALEGEVDLLGPGTGMAGAERRRW